MLEPLNSKPETNHPITHEEAPQFCPIGFTRAAIAQLNFIQIESPFRRKRVSNGVIKLYEDNVGRYFH